MRVALASTLLVAVMTSATASAQAPVDLWYPIAQDSIVSSTGAEARHAPGTYRIVGLNREALFTLLAQAPLESDAAARSQQILMDVPWPTGGVRRFRIEEAPIMAPDLAAQFPEIKTYRGQSLDDATASVSFDWTPQGFHAQVLSADGTVYVDPYSAGDTGRYISYFRRGYARNDGRAFRCDTTGEEISPRSDRRDLQAYQALHGDTLRTYRLALAATGEYTQFFGGTVPGAMAAMVTTMNRVNGIYERDIAVRMILIGNNSSLVYTNGATDPYTNEDGFDMLCQNAMNIDAVIGAGAYDIGHVFSTGGGGIASLRSVCSSANFCGISTPGSQKARGVTGLPAPTGDAFDVDYVAHEIGHQFGGNHTFAGTMWSCGGNGNATTAYEPGSGSTIMAYAGICGAEDLQPHSDAYFHTGSLTEMISFITNSVTGGSCAATTPQPPNGLPTVSAGADFTIPSGTPFTLTATGSDPDADALTYTWEQMNTSSLLPPAASEGPLFRSFAPTTSPSRTFPRMSVVLSGLATFGEALPTTTRTLSFRVTVRDNHSGGGGTATDDMVVNVRGESGPFVVTQPNTAVSWAAGSTRTIAWNVANTTAPPVNAANVKISLSINGGATFPIVLAASTPNDGSESVTLPIVTTSMARIKVEAVGNIFFDVSNANFSITGGGTGPSMTLDKTTLNFGGVITSIKGVPTLTTRTATQTIRLTKSGAGTVSWTAVPSQPWLQVVPSSGTNSAVIDVTVTTSLPMMSTGTIDFMFTGAGNSTGPVTVTLTPTGLPANPFGFVDTPLQKATGLTGTVPFTGWALDDVEVTGVVLCRAAVLGEAAPIDARCGGAAQIYVGNAVFIDGARADVALAAPNYPLYTRAGWGFAVLTNMLPNQGNGTYSFFIYLTDRDGHTVLLDARTITCANAGAIAPFGAIDTPGQGETVSGSAYVNFGWALTPMPKVIPIDGSTINVIVDGALVGNVTYNNFRSDIATLFPELNNTNGPIGFRTIDTTALANGLHTIAWGVTDSNGVASGIGSRFFTVSNGARTTSEEPASGEAASVVSGFSRTNAVASGFSRTDSVASALRRTITNDDVNALPLDARAIVGRRGWDLRAPLRRYTAAAGVTTVYGEELDRFELYLGDQGLRISGYLRAGDALQPLPIGSHLDATTGVFTWHPGVGFVGVYNLVFVHWAGGRATSRHEVRIVLNAKGSGRVGPQVVIDAPRTFDLVDNTFYLGGWAADLDAESGTGIATLHVWAYPVSGDAPIFLGAAATGGARPDVRAIYGEQFRDSGYGLIVQGLPAGDYDLAVFAYRTAAGDFLPAKVVRVTVE